MNNSDEFGEEKLNQIKLFIYFIPIVGLVPALWTLSRAEPNPTEQRFSRLSLQLAIAWAIAYSLLWFGATQSSELLSFRLLYLNGLLTSGYFLACFAIILSLRQGKLNQFKLKKPKNLL